MTEQRGRILRILNHIMNHFWKYLTLIVISAVGWSGYSCDTKYFKFKKEQVNIKGDKHE